MYNRESFSDYYREIFQKVRSELLRETEQQILGSDPQELTDYYLSKYALEPIQYDPEREETFDYQNYVKNIPAHEREEFYREEGDIDWDCEKIVVEIPILPNSQIERIASLQSSTRSFSYSVKEFNFYRDKVVFNIETKGYGFNQSEEQIAQDVRERTRAVKELIGWKNQDIVKENEHLKNQILSLINQRREALQANKAKIDALTKKIDIPLKKKANHPLQRIQLDHKPIVKRIKPAPSLPEECVLEDAKVYDIVEVLDNQAKNFERTPASLKSLGEEDLRNLLLSNLNSIFEGRATGETFNKKGKTDIYLAIDKGNILVFECKIWDGKKLYHETIDQLRGYLTWRENFGVMISFVRRKNFTQVLGGITEIIQENNSFVGGFSKVNDTHFISKHVLDDADKHVKVHHLFYNLYSGK